MASVSLAAMEVNCLNDSIFSLLDTSWYAQSILKQCTVSIPSTVNISSTSFVQVESAFRSREADVADSRRASWSVEQKCSTSQSFTNGNSFGVQRRCSVSELEMRSVFDRFDSNGDGLISEEELRRYMSCCGKDVSDAEVHSLIESVDHNQDGSVDFQEFLSLYQNYSGGDATREPADKGACENSDEALFEAFRVFDKNDDGFISAQELQAVLLNLGMAEGRSLIRCQKMIRNVDRDGDGHCDISEFQQLMSQAHDN